MKKVLSQSEIDMISSRPRKEPIHYHKSTPSSSFSGKRKISQKEIERQRDEFAFGKQTEPEASKPSNNQLLATAKYHFVNKDIALAMKAVRAVAQQTRRQGARLQAARIILEHEVDLVKYENPQEQRFRHTVDVPNEMTVRVIDGNA